MIYIGDCLETLRTIESDSIDCIVTSPPYWGLRDYGVDGQIGQEPDFRKYIAKLVEVFEECRRVLKPSGTCWVNMGDSYTAAPVGSFNGGGFKDKSSQTGGRDLSGVETSGRLDKTKSAGLKPKDLVGIPWRLAFALQEAGWYLRSDIIWHKPNPMPESVRDRPTKAHEYLFLLTKSQRYYYDADAIAEPALYVGDDRGSRSDSRRGTAYNSMSGVTGATKNARTVWEIGARLEDVAQEIADYALECSGMVNPDLILEAISIQVPDRTVWRMATTPTKEAHFATFPPELPKRCILAGCPEGGTVLDPFAGSGTTLMVAKQLGRKWVGIELNPEYAEMARKRVEGVTGSLFEDGL